MEYKPIPPDDLTRALRLAKGGDTSLPHVGLLGDTYTITVGGEDTDGRFCVIDMHIPPGGGPGLHRHDFEETFVVLEGEIEATFRGQRLKVGAGDTINITSNAPHRFHNVSPTSARMICICAPAGNDEFFLEVGVPVATSTTPPPVLDAEGMAGFLTKAKELTPKYRTELLEEV